MTNNNDLPPSGQLINGLLKQSGVGDALHDIEKNNAAPSESKGRPAYKLQSPEQRAIYFAEDAAYAWWRLVTWWLPRRSKP